MDLLIILVLVAIVAIGAFLLLRRRKRDVLQSKFGPEYSRVVEKAGSAREAEAELKEREKRVSAFEIRPLAAADRERFTDGWQRVQADFVDDPRGAVTRADVLLGDLMSARGYPVSDFEQRSADLSVDHPVVVQNYRSAHEIADRHARGEAGTEDLRQAMIHYRALFDELSRDAPAGEKTASTSARGA
jgi:hypothetical protein